MIQRASFRVSLEGVLQRVFYGGCPAKEGFLLQRVSYIIMVSCYGDYRGYCTEGILLQRVSCYKGCPCVRVSCSEGVLLQKMPLCQGVLLQRVSCYKGCPCVRVSCYRGCPATKDALVSGFPATEGVLLATD